MIEVALYLFVGFWLVFGISIALGSDGDYLEDWEGMLLVLLWPGIVVAVVAREIAIVAIRLGRPVGRGAP